MGVGGFVLGLVYLALGIFFFLCSKKGVCWGAHNSAEMSSLAQRWRGRKCLLLTPVHAWIIALFHFRQCISIPVVCLCPFV